MLHTAHPLLVGLFLLSAGAGTRYYLALRRFQRRTPTGLEWFSSYGKAVMIQFCEAIVRFAAAVCILAGALLILAASA